MSVHHHSAVRRSASATQLKALERNHSPSQLTRAASLHSARSGPQLPRTEGLNRNASADCLATTALSASAATSSAAFVSYSTPAATSETDAEASAQQQATRDFDKMISTSELPVLVDFHAQWCGPCLMMSNVLTVVSKSLRGAITCVKLDADKYPGLAARYKIKALPTLVLFKNGKVVDKVEGFVPAPKLQDRVNFRLDRPLGPGRSYKGP